MSIIINHTDGPRPPWQIRAVRSKNQKGLGPPPIPNLYTTTTVQAISCLLPAVARQQGADQTLLLAPVVDALRDGLRISRLRPIHYSDPGVGINAGVGGSQKRSNQQRNTEWYTCADRIGHRC